MKVKEAMHNITKVPSDMTVSEAARVMTDRVIGSVLVEENNDVIGIMTERDILRKAVNSGKSCEEIKVKEIMTENIISIDANAPLEDASGLLAKYKIRRLIVKENEKIIGIITARNIAERIRYALAKDIVKGRQGY